MVRNRNDRVVSLFLSTVDGCPRVVARETSVADQLAVLNSAGVTEKPSTADESKIQETSRNLVSLRLALIAEGGRLCQYDQAKAEYENWLAQLEIYIAQYRIAQAYYLLRNYDACSSSCRHLSASLAARRPLLASELPACFSLEEAGSKVA